ncbi:ABC transporter permease subunit [Halobacillus litoralis]|uniref:ABC transporter permease subunit n=1 Tax=Halobacillus litoralis TaxID=45668 RepID=A0A845FCS9_9BACI|nr:ABC transporter permease subunit [Halobacillus litoralis]MYL71608.1 ABC transporter permease subunit [Halobacillus litoralis]
MTRNSKILVFIGAAYLIGLMVASFGYSHFIEPKLAKPEKLLIDDDGSLIAMAPFPPSMAYPLGSDIDGNSYLTKIIEGAKYTIGLSVIIALGRVLLSLLGGYLLFLLPTSMKRTFKGLSDALHYAPVTVFTYILITPVILTFSWSYDLTTKIVFPCLVIIAVSVPVLSLYVQEEIDLASNNEFIDNARTMGASRFHIFKKHIVPFLTPKVVVTFVQQMGQTLIIFAHLGLLNVFIGGSDTRVMEYDIETGDAITETFTMSNEWAGMISDNFQYIRSFPWMVLAPVTAFALTILAINFIAYGLKANRKPKRVNVPQEKLKTTSMSLDKEKFRMVK